ncbi:hypothetical protein NFI96_006003 [Prochilodus magdalenae]|nr:hypothetical protein NFI96_006003 [Prochilodus magdalenae]
MSSELQRLLAKQQIAFSFNPPAAPHFGGVWEREVRSIKEALYRTVGAQPVQEEILQTVLLEVESILNSRPLGYVSSDVADIDPVTANLLLMGRLDGALPPVIYPETANFSQRRWRHAQVLADHFWLAFIRHYLPSLQVRAKWFKALPGVPVDAVVLVVDPQQPRAQWPMGRVVKTHPSRDGQNTHDCITTNSSNNIIKFADDTTIIDITTKDDKGPYREEVKLLTEWCAANNIALNVNKTKELIIDFRKVGKNAQATNHWRHVGGKSEQLQDPQLTKDLT